MGKRAVAALLSFANFHLSREVGDDWGTEAEGAPFLHAWSLSLEEQFCPFFPIATWLAFRFRPRRTLGGITAIVIGSFGLLLWGARAFPTATFHRLPTGAWEVSAGSLLAVVRTSRSPGGGRGEVLAVAGLGLVVAPCVFLDALGPGALLVVLGTILVIAFGDRAPARGSSPSAGSCTRGRSPTPSTCRTGPPRWSASAGEARSTCGSTGSRRSDRAASLISPTAREGPRPWRPRPTSPTRPSPTS